MSARFHLKFLGPVQVECEGAPYRKIRSRKALALLGYVIAHGESVSREILANVFWPDLAEDRALTNLSWTLSLLSQHLPACLVIDRRTVCFQPSTTVVADVETFRTLIATHDPARLAEAVTLYDDEFMAGFYLDKCPNFETWLLAEREHWRRQLEEALASLIQHERVRGAYRKALPYAIKLLRQDPYNEAAHRYIMGLLALNGQRSAALNQFETCRRLLQDEFGVEPGDKTKALYEQIRAGPSPEEEQVPRLKVSPAAQWYLPSPFTPFFGRESELALLDQHLKEPQIRLVTIIGVGGVGKTRLALQSAERHQQLFRDGIGVVPLTPVHSREELVFAIAEGLGQTFVSGGEPETQLFHLLSARELLLVLDNFEHLLAERALLLELLHRTPRLKLLVTSREPLHLQAEQVLRLEGLEVVAEERGEVASSAVRLFVERARRLQASFSLSAPPLGSIVEICRLVEGNPLGIELAAAWAASSSCEEIAQAIRCNLDVLATTMHDLPERHRSLRSVFDHSWELLAADEQRAFRALAVFRGGFDAEAARQVGEVTAPVLAVLQDKSLLQRSSSGRYVLHELLWQYAAEQLAADPEEEQKLKARHAAWYLALAKAAGPELNGVHQTDGLAQLEREHANLLKALEWACAHEQVDLALRLSEALWLFWQIRGDFRQACHWLERALALAVKREPLPPATQAAAARCQGRLGDLLRILGLSDQAMNYLQRAYTTLERMGTRRDFAVVSGLLGRLKLHVGDVEGARTYLDQQLCIAEEFHDTAETAVALNNLGVLARACCDYSQAQAIWGRLLNVVRSSNDRFMLCKVLNSLAVVSIDLEDYLSAFELFRQSVEIAIMHDFRVTLCLAVGNVGECYLRYGLSKQAFDCTCYSLQIALELGYREAISLMTVQLARLMASEGRRQLADTLYRQGIELERTNKSPYDLANALSHRAADLFDQGYSREALADAREALSVVQEYRFAAHELLIRIRSLVIRLQAMLREVDPSTALVEALALKETAQTPKEQAALCYLLWKLEPANGGYRAAAAEQYAGLAREKPDVEYRQRYAELTGTELPLPLALPDLSALTPEPIQPLEALLEMLQASR